MQFFTKRETIHSICYSQRLPALEYLKSNQLYTSCKIFEKLKGTVYQKNDNSVIIYPPHCSRFVQMSLFSWDTQRWIYGRMFVNKQIWVCKSANSFGELLTTIIIFPTMEVNVAPKPFGYKYRCVNEDNFFFGDCPFSYSKHHQYEYIVKSNICPFQHLILYFRHECAILIIGTLKKHVPYALNGNAFKTSFCWTRVIWRERAKQTSPLLSPCPPARNKNETLSTLPINVLIEGWCVTMRW